MTVPHPKRHVGKQKKGRIARGRWIAGDKPPWPLAAKAGGPAYQSSLTASTASLPAAARPASQAVTVPARMTAAQSASSSAQGRARARSMVHGPVKALRVDHMHQHQLLMLHREIKLLLQRTKSEALPRQTFSR